MKSILKNIGTLKKYNTMNIWSFAKEKFPSLATLKNKISEATKIIGSAISKATVSVKSNLKSAFNILKQQGENVGKAIVNKILGRPVKQSEKQSKTESKKAESILTPFEPVKEEFFKNVIYTYQAKFKDFFSVSYESDLNAAAESIIEFLNKIYDEIGGPFKVDIGYTIQIFNTDRIAFYTIRSKFF